MLKARKRNRVIPIPDEQAEAYQALGYRVTTAEGEPVLEPVDKDALIESLTRENAMLKQKLAEEKLLRSGKTDEG